MRIFEWIFWILSLPFKAVWGATKWGTKFALREIIIGSLLGMIGLDTSDIFSDE